MIKQVDHPPTNVPGCPEKFQADTYMKISQSAHDVPTVDAKGQHPLMSDQLASVGAVMTLEQWTLLATLTNPSWEPTYERVVLDDPVEHEVADCPNCGTPIKVG